MLNSNKNKVAILLIAFNRPDTTVQVLESLSLYAPEKLYIATDGARQNDENDTKQVAAIHQLINDWKKNNPGTTVHTLYQSQNLGCGLGPTAAISWFFEQEEMGIILEDDCVPKQSFFTFCEKLLPYYADNEKIFGLSGTNLQAGINRGDAAYYFSKYSVIWGWATWARAWKKYSYEMKGFDKFISDNKLSEIFSHADEIKYWQKVLQNASKLGSWWDYQWVYNVWLHNAIFIVPNVNLVNNIGFSSTGTHTLKEPGWYKKLINNDKVLPAVITHPKTIAVNEAADRFLFTKAYNPKSFLTLLKKLFQKKP